MRWRTRPAPALSAVRQPIRRPLDAHDAADASVSVSCVAPPVIRDHPQPTDRRDGVSRSRDGEYLEWSGVVGPARLGAAGQARAREDFERSGEIQHFDIVEDQDADTLYHLSIMKPRRIVGTLLANSPSRGVPITACTSRGLKWFVALNNWMPRSADRFFTVKVL